MLDFGFLQILSDAGVKIMNSKLKIEYVMIIEPFPACWIFPCKSIVCNAFDTFWCHSQLEFFSKRRFFNWWFVSPKASNYLLEKFQLFVFLKKCCYKKDSELVFFHGQRMKTPSNPLYEMIFHLWSVYE